MIGLASAWLRHLLAAEMRIEDLMRLWGEYASSMLTNDFCPIDTRPLR